MYNFSSMCALLNAIIFFAYPSVGFNHKYILFENVYSIGTHALLLIISISLITLKFTEFRYHNGSFKNSAIKELICLAIVFAYAFIEIYVLKIEKDPLYFMPDNDVQVFLSVTYPLYLVIYTGFLIFYFNIFYLIEGLIKKIKKS